MAPTHRHAGRLPVDLTSFVGREDELDASARLLRTARLLTLAGVGGVGKTRLALHVAESLSEGTSGDVPEQVCLVDLTTVDDAGLVPSVAAEALGVPDVSGTLAAGDLARQVSDRSVLVVLDNCEHVVEGCAALAEELLRQTTTVSILATSRQPLGVRGEHVLSVPPLDAPSAHDRSGPDALASSPALTLFLDRAGAARPEFTLTADNSADVVALCRALDGLPLALELAAVRMRALSPAQLLERLARNTHVLTGAARTAQPRQHSLTALMDWSYQLCSDAERALWGRVSVFSGGFDLDAAQQVCSGAGIEVDEVIDLVVGLVDKSVLLRADHNGRPRYRLLETIRRFGRERLAESGEHDRVQRRHREYVQRLVDDAATHWFGPDDLTWLDLLRVEHANLRAALEACTRTPAEAVAGLRLATTFWLMWRTAGWVTEGRQWLDRLVALAPARSPLVVRALWVDGWLALIQGDRERAVELLRRSETTARELGADVECAFVDLFLGQVETHHGDFEAAERRLSRGLEVHRGTGDAAGLALSTFRLAVCQAAAGDAAAAVATAEAGLQFCRERGARWWSGYARWSRAVALWCGGDPASALEEATTSVTIAGGHDDELGTAMALEIVAWASVDTEPARAARILGALHGRWADSGSALAGYGSLIDHHQVCRDRAARRLGADRFAAEQARGAARRIAGAVQELVERPAGNDPAGSGTPLSRREHQVADLVARGRTNKEIAKALVIAQRTAESHVENIRSKLGVTSRAQIAAWVVERRASATPH